MADEKRTTDSSPSGQNSGRQEQQGGNSQDAYFDPANYNNDPENMANYTGNYGTGTYDTDYGKGTFPETSAKKQGDNWVDKVRNDQQGQDNSSGSQDRQQNDR